MLVQACMHSVSFAASIKSQHSVLLSSRYRVTYTDYRIAIEIVKTLAVKRLANIRTVGNLVEKTLAN